MLCQSKYTKNGKVEMKLNLWYNLNEAINFVWKLFHTLLKLYVGGYKMKEDFTSRFFSNHTTDIAKFYNEMENSSYMYK